MVRMCHRQQSVISANRGVEHFPPSDRSDTNCCTSTVLCSLCLQPVSLLSLSNSARPLLENSIPMCFSNEKCCATLKLPIIKASSTGQSISGIGQHIDAHPRSGTQTEKQMPASSTASSASDDCPSVEDIIRCIDGAAGRDREHESECLELREKFHTCIMTERHIP